MTESQSNNLPDRIRAIPSRTRLLIATGAFLLIVAVFFQGCRGMEIEREEAIATARTRIAFGALAPERSDARILRQGIPTSSQWIVVFRIIEPDGGPKDFLCHASVYIDAARGDVRRDANFSQSSDDCPWTLAADV